MDSTSEWQNRRLQDEPCGRERPMNNNNPEGYFFFTTALAGFWRTPFRWVEAPDRPPANRNGWTIDQDNTLRNSWGLKLPTWALSPAYPRTVLRFGRTRTRRSPGSAPRARLKP